LLGVVEGLGGAFVVAWRPVRGCCPVVVEAIAGFGVGAFVLAGGSAPWADLALVWSLEYSFSRRVPRWCARPAAV
jgi:hypothetical protein